MSNVSILFRKFIISGSKHKSKHTLWSPDKKLLAVKLTVPSQALRPSVLIPARCPGGAAGLSLGLRFIRVVARVGHLRIVLVAVGDVDHAGCGHVPLAGLRGGVGRGPCLMAGAVRTGVAGAGSVAGLPAS